MSKYLRLSVTVLVLMTFAGSLAVGQAPGTTATQAPTTSVKLQVVVSKYDGDKKLSSLPYTLILVPGRSGSIRSGSEVPVPTTSLQGTPDKPATTSYTLQQIGTQIDATVNTTSDGKYNLKLTVTDRFAGTVEPQRVPNVPSFKNVVIASEAILANAETIQFTAAPTPTGNEIFKVDVTLTVGNK
jgi:hypothetical protein